MLELLAAGEAHRHFGETKMNVNSSRSHTLFRMVRHFCGLAVVLTVWRRHMRGLLLLKIRNLTLLLSSATNAQCYLLRWQVVESRAREQSADEHDSGAVWVSALTLVDLAGRCSEPMSNYACKSRLRDAHSRTHCDCDAIWPFDKPSDSRMLLTSLR